MQQAHPITLTIDKVTRRFGTRGVFSEVSATVSTGQSLVITGPNGSGKSTLLRIVAGLLPASGGKVCIELDGRPLDADAARAALGLVAPDLQLYRELSAAENLLFFGRLRGMKLTREDLIAILTRVGLRGRGRDLVGAYSSGMRQRLKYAFALLHAPPILLLDEPTANLDAAGAEIVRSIIAEQKQHGLVVIATNEAHELAWGDSIVRLG